MNYYLNCNYILEFHYFIFLIEIFFHNSDKIILTEILIYIHKINNLKSYVKESKGYCQTKVNEKYYQVTKKDLIWIGLKVG